MATVLPVQDKYAGLRQGLNNLVQGQMRQHQNRQTGQQLRQLIGNLPANDPIRMAGQNLDLSNPAIANMMGQALQAKFSRAPLPPRDPTILGRDQVALDPVTHQQVGAGPTTPTAGPVQKAQPGDGSNLPPGTSFQRQANGNVTIIKDPQPLTADEQRHAALIQAGIQPEEITRLEKRKQKADLDKVLVDTQKIKNESGGVLTTTERLDFENKLRTQFNSESSDFFKIRDSFATIQAANPTDPSGVSDLSLIFAFMKMLDPTSVVRESEFATAANAGSTPDSAINAYNSVLNGQKLAATRGQFIKQAERIFKRQSSIQGRRIERFEDITKREGGNPLNVVEQIQLKTGQQPVGTITSGDVTLPQPASGLTTDQKIAEAEAKLEALTGGQ